MYNYEQLKITSVSCFYYNAYSPNLTLKHLGKTMKKYEMDIITSGRAHLVVDDIPYFFYPGDICFRKPKQHNLHLTDTPYESMHIRFLVENHGDADNFFTLVPTFIPKEKGEDIRNAVFSFHKYFCYDSGYNSIMCDAMLTMLKAALYKHVYPSETEKPIIYHTAVQKALSLMYKNIDMPLHIDELAEYCGYSPKHFQKIFKQTTGLTPHQYLLDIRIKKAQKDLRTTEHSIMQISQDCGFLNSNHFAEVFKRKTGMTPKQFRQENP